MSTKPTVAFFGATGGCVNVSLVHTLRAGIPAVALVRTPQKLKDILLKQGLTEQELDANLTVIEGNALDVAAVKKTLLANSNTLPAVIVSGLGAAPVFHFKPLTPWRIMSIDQPTLCGDAAKTLTTALKEIYQENPALASKKPYLTFVSTTGISSGAEDVPYSMRFLYHWVLHIPHLDKRQQEAIHRGNMDQADQQKSLYSGITIVRPTLLTGAADVNDAAGLDKVRVGIESKPELGFTVKRADVGQWMFLNVIESEDKRRPWVNEAVSLTS